MSDSTEPRNGTDVPKSAAASLFDLRTVIAVLFGVYGLVLLIMGLVATDEADLAKAGDANINLDTGIAMLVVAALFVVWVVARPIRPPTPTEPDQMGPSVEPDRTGPF